MIIQVNYSHNKNILRLFYNSIKLCNFVLDIHLKKIAIAINFSSTKLEIFIIFAV